jgi:hypothetical protein
MSWLVRKKLLRKNKKAPPFYARGFYLSDSAAKQQNKTDLFGYDADKCPAICAFNLKLYFAVNRSEDGMIFTHANVDARMKMGASLPYDDVSCGNQFSAKAFNA